MGAVTPWGLVAVASRLAGAAAERVDTVTRAGVAAAMATGAAMAAVLASRFVANVPMPCLPPGRPGCSQPRTISGLGSKKWPMIMAMVKRAARRSCGVGAGWLFVDLRGGGGHGVSSMAELGMGGHPALIWSRRFRASEANLDGLRNCLADQSEAVVMVDSLRSITRSCDFGENDPEM